MLYFFLTNLAKLMSLIFAKSPLARTQDQFFESWMVLTAIDLGFKMELEHLLAQPFESISSGFSKVR
jgi:hypothetical protein